MMVRQIASSLKNAESRREDKLKLSLVAQFGAAHPNCSRWVLSSSASPTATMQLNILSARTVGLHLIALLIHELISVVSSNDEARYSGGRELSNRTHQIAEDRG
ncbi:hypothetical protein FBQ96_14800, partial [Nitrospirales bacterium NOB]|nr:hypothetical protein [Nitrospirales bacterium NOB]